MPSHRRALGGRGESLAAEHLRAAGYTIIARNWRSRAGELDLVAQHGDEVIFVEVKTRHSGDWSPEEGVGPLKAERLLALAYAYLDAAGLPESTPWRIDVIAVELDRGGRLVRLEQIEHAVGE